MPLWHVNKAIWDTYRSCDDPVLSWDKPGSSYGEVTHLNGLDNLLMKAQITLKTILI